MVKASNFQVARHKYAEAIAFCPNADEKPILYSNMAFCSIKMQKYEQAFSDLQLFEKTCSGIEISPVITIKTHYRWALVKAFLRDYHGSKDILTKTKQLCNVYEQNDLWKEVCKLSDHVGAMINQSQGKFRLKNIVER